MSTSAPTDLIHGYHPRITPRVFTVLQFFFLSLSIVAAVGRTGTRIYRFRRVTLDDFFLILAVIFFTISTGVIYAVTDLVYYTTEVTLGITKPPKNYNELTLRFSIFDNVVTVFVWGSLFSVKLSFVLFFRQLIERVRHLQLWWWIVFGILCAATPTNMFLGFSVCPVFTLDISEVCGAGIGQRTTLYLMVSTGIDILTDLLVLSIPVALLWKVKIDFRRKLALGTVLCLSLFMIAIAILRVSLVAISAPSGRKAPDNAWIFFWQNVEAATAIVMVSLTAFRSMLGQAKTTRPSHKGSGSRSRAHGIFNRRPRSDQDPLQPVKNSGHIVKTTEIANSIESCSDSRQDGQPSISHPETMEMMSAKDASSERPQGRLPMPPKPAYEADIRSSSSCPSVDMRYHEASSIERG